MQATIATDEPTVVIDLTDRMQRLRDSHLRVLPQSATETTQTDWVDWGTRFGVAAIFFVNALAAFVTPESFRSVLEANPIASLLPTALLDPMVMLAGVNDVLLGIAIMSGRHRRYVWAWMALWLGVVGGVKLINMLA